MIIGAELEICPGYGWMGGPEFATRIVALRGGQERRNQTSARVRHRYVLPFNNIRDDDYLARLKNAFLACRGQLHSFLVKDRSDYLANNQIFGTGNGVSTQFQLRIFSSFGDVAYDRVITRPVAPIVTVDGSEAPASIDTDTGVVTLPVPPDSGAVLRWSGEFRVPVRFAQDALPMTIDNRFTAGAGSYAINGSVELIEVWE